MPPLAVVNEVPGATPPAVKTSMVSPSGSPSLPIRLPDNVAGAVSSLNVVKLSSLAIGGVLAGSAVGSVTSMETLATTQLPDASHTSYSNVSSPTNPSFGANVYDPSGFMFTTPLAVVIGDPIGDPLTMVTVSTSPSGSVSLLSTLPLTGVSIEVIFISSSASGGPLIMVLTELSVALTDAAAPVELTAFVSVTSKFSCGSLNPSSTIPRLISSGANVAPSAGAV